MKLRLHEVEKLIKGERRDRSFQMEQVRALILETGFE